MSTRRLLVWITFLAVFAMTARISLDTDTWWHIRTGEWILENRAVPLTDPFSYTRYGEDWDYPAWLLQIPLMLVYRVVGPGWLNLWVAMIITAAFYFVWKAMEGGEFLKAFILILAVTVSGIFWSARPHLMTLFLSGVFLFILEDYRYDRKNRLWLLPILMVVWANSHGGFANGIIIGLVYGVGFSLDWLGALWKRRNAARKARSFGEVPDPSLDIAVSQAFRKVWQLFVVGLILVVAMTISPYGVDQLLYPFETVNMQILQDYIQEWQPPDFQNLSVQPFAWMLLLTLGAVGASRRGLETIDFLLVAVFAYMGLLAGRNIALFALASPIVLSRHAGLVVDHWQKWLGLRPFKLGERPPTKLQSRVNLFLLIVVFLVVALKTTLVVPLSINEKFIADNYPVRAVEYLKETRPPGNLFNSYNWGGYILWALPEYPTFVDGRTDLYNDEILGQWLQVVRADDGWQQVLDRWQVRVVFLEKGTPVLRFLEAEGWQKAYEDDKAVIFTR